MGDFEVGFRAPWSRQWNTILQLGSF